MSFIARRSPSDKIEDSIDAKDVTNPSIDYYCPYCSCIFRYKAEASNKRAAHFFKSGEHSPDCQMSDVNLIKGKVDRNIAAKTNFYDFYQNIINTKEKVKSKNKMVNHHVRNSTSVLHLNTVRNMYKFCSMVSDREYIGSVQVKDIFVARKTKYLYTSYIQGIKLVEAKFNHYNSKTNALFFYYPCDAESYKKAQFQLQVIIEDDALFKKKRKILFTSIGTNKKCLLLAQWTTVEKNVSCKVTSTHQIVLL